MKIQRSRFILFQNRVRNCIIACTLESLQKLSVTSVVVTIYLRRYLFNFRKLNKLRALVTQNEDLKKEEQEFKAKCLVSNFPGYVLYIYLC